MTKLAELQEVKALLTGEDGPSLVNLGVAESAQAAHKVAQSYRVPASIHKLGLRISITYWPEIPDVAASSYWSVDASLRPVKAEA